MNEKFNLKISKNSESEGNISFETDLDSLKNTSESAENSDPREEVSTW